MKSIRTLLLIFFLALAPMSSFAQDSGTSITSDNISDLALLMRLGRGSAEGMVWSPDGSSVFVGGSLGVWQYEAANLDTDTEPTLIRVGGEVYDLSISPDGSTLVVSHTNGDGIALYTLGTDALPQVIELEEGNGRRLAFSPTGQYVTVNRASSGVTVYDTAGNSVYTQASTSLDADVRILMTADDGKLIAANNSSDVLVWDLSVGGDPTPLDGHTSGIEDMTISPDGSLLVTGSSDDSIILWDLATNTLVEQIMMPEDDFSNRDVYAVEFNADGSQLLTGHRDKIRVWDVAERSIASEFSVRGAVEDIRFSPDGTQIAVLATDYANALQIYTVNGTLISSTLGHNNTIEAVTFNPESEILVFSDSDKNLYLWDTTNPQEITFATKITEGATFGVSNTSNLVYSSDGRYLATLQSFSADLRDPLSGALIREFDDVDGIAEDIEFSPDNSLLAFITSAGLYVFDVETGARIAYFSDANDWMTDVTWSADQTMIATAARDNAVRVYHITAE